MSSRLSLDWQSIPKDPYTQRHRCTNKHDTARPIHVVTPQSVPCRDCPARPVHGSHAGDFCCRDTFDAAAALFQRLNPNTGLCTAINLPVNYCRTACHQRSVFISAVKVWNSLPPLLKGEPNPIKFLNDLKRLLYCRY